MYVNRIQNNTNLAADFINRPINAENAEKSVVKINIFYSSLSYSNSIESPYMDSETLLGQIGGTLGLFMGISLLSISEIIEVLMEIFFISLGYKGKCA